MSDTIGVARDLKKMNLRMYSQTNEDLDALFKNFNFKNKEVLSVLGSSDQMLNSYYMGAKKVDTFDRNERAAYYYYFRKWFINSYNEAYPYFRSNINKFAVMVNDINPTNDLEAKSKSFWLSVLNDSFKEYDYFEYLPYCQRNKFEKDEKFIKKILNNDLVYKKMDMFNNIDIQKKYDIVILSNMLEYLNGDKEALFRVRKNLESILKNNGQVICSYIVNDHLSDKFLLEKEILTQNDLVFEDYYTYYEPLLGRDNEAGYSYKLKKN